MPRPADRDGDRLITHSDVHWSPDDAAGGAQVRSRAAQVGVIAADRPAMSVAGIPVTARVADVHARIATIQSKFGPAPSAGGGTAVQFSNLLTDAVGAASGTASVQGGSAVAAPAAPAGAGSANAGQRAVEIAKQQLGKPYVWGAESPAVGFDCSGLVQHTFKQLGVELPRVSRDQARAGQAVASLAEARPGDLIAFGSPVDHIGIYAGNNKMVVAPRRGDVVKVQEVYRTPTAIRRVV